MPRDPSATETDPERGAIPPARETKAVELPAIDPDAYELLGEVARGGMGRIMRARDRRLDRLVAIKQLLVTSPRLAALFEREVRITARLQHPSIVSVYEAGVLPGGELVYAMKLVPGRSLRDVLRDGGAGVALLPVVIAIADALAYAHQQRIVHRDLKPGNVLVGEFGEVVVIDWGLAKDLGSDTADDVDGAPPAAAEATAAAMGTPAYMPPEAARGEPADERADVYAIGAILREVLTGEAPYRGDDGAAVLAAVRAGPPPPMPRAARVPADLAAIVAKAMARERTARYPTARELADELRRFQTGQLVSAHAYSLRDRVARWLRKNRAPVAVAGLASALVIGLVAVGVARIVRERDVAAERTERLTLAQARLLLDRDPQAALATLASLPPRSSHWGAARVLAADARARGVATSVAARGDVIAVAVGADGPRTLVREETRLRILGGGGGELASWALATPAEAVAMSADGGTVAIVDAGGSLRVWAVDAPDRAALELPGPRVAARLALAADGSAIAAGGRDFGVRAWTRDGVERLRDDTARDADAVAVGPGARAVAFATGAEVALRGDHVRTIDVGARVIGLAVSPAGDAIACASADGAVRIEAVAGGAAVVVRHDAPVSAIAFAAAAPVLVTAADRDVLVWGRDGRRRRVLVGLRASASAVAIDAAGDSVVAVDPHGAWRWSGLAADATLLSGSASPGLGLVTAGTTAVSVSDDGSVWRWDLQARTGRPVGGHAAAARAVAIDAGGRIASAGDDRTVRLWDGDADRVLGSHRAAALAVAFSPDGGAVASGGADRAVRLWSTAVDGGARVLGQHAGPVIAVAFTPDGRSVVSIGDEPAAIVWPIDGGASRRLVHEAAVTALAISSDGVHVATGTRSGLVEVWAIAGGAPRVLALHDGPVRGLAFSPDGRRVASASDDGRGRVTSLEGRSVVLDGHDDFVHGVAFSPDGATIATASDDGTVRLWDAASGEGRSLRAGAWVAGVAFSGDGDQVVATGEGGGLWIWRDDLPRERVALRRLIVAAAGDP